MADSTKASEAMPASARPAQTTLRFDATNATHSYANTCHVSSTKEEVVLNFGLNQNWERNQPEMQVQLTNRIILSPYAAKRLALILSAVIKQHEARFGSLDVSGGRPDDALVKAPEPSGHFTEAKLHPVKR